MAMAELLEVRELGRLLAFARERLSDDGDDGAEVELSSYSDSEVRQSLRSTVQAGTPLAAAGTR